MKLKQSPDDFEVTEQTDVRPGPEGEFAFYRLVKRGWTTPDALQVIRRRWKVNLERIAYGGLKDRHAHTTQYLTIVRGPERNLAQQGITLTYLGRLKKPFSSADVRANSFTLTLRDLSDSALNSARLALDEVAEVGVPNYFDDQRFSSVAGSQFIAREMVLGRFEEALRLALTAPYEYDRAEAKREKAILRDCWGNWPVCQERLPRGHVRSLVGYLADNPTDFRGALARLRPELRGLYLSVYQSHLWNRILARWIEQHVPEEERLTLSLRLGPVPAPRAIPAALRPTWESLTLPLPSARLRLDPGAPWAELVEAVMAQEGIALSEMRVRGMDKPFFSKGDRLAILRPANLEHRAEADERHAGRQKLILKFDLPRGVYATMIVKRITQPA